MVLAASVAFEVGGEGRVDGQGGLDGDDEVAGKVGNPSNWKGLALHPFIYPKLLRYSVCSHMSSTLEGFSQIIVGQIRLERSRQQNNSPEVGRSGRAKHYETDLPASSGVRI